MTGDNGASDRFDAAAAVGSVALDAPAIARFEAEAIERGEALFLIDLAGAEDKAALLERTAAALHFPDWFGHNWDAWFDCLADLSWIAPAQGYVLLLRRARGLQRSAPEVLDTALAVAEDAARVWAGRGIRFRLFVDTENAD